MAPASKRAEQLSPFRPVGCYAAASMPSRGGPHRAADARRLAQHRDIDALQMQLERILDRAAAPLQADRKRQRRRRRELRRLADGEMLIAAEACDRERRF